MFCWWGLEWYVIKTTKQKLRSFGAIIKFMYLRCEWHENEQQAKYGFWLIWQNIVNNFKFMGNHKNKSIVVAQKFQFKSNVINFEKWCFKNNWIRKN